MSKIEELKQTYIKDLSFSSSKRKFGYFSMPPSAFAANTDQKQKIIQKDENGKVITQHRNIFPGLCASGVLKKTYFSYPQYRTGQIYLDPGKAQRLKQLKQNQKFKDKETFRPASLNKTLATASYEYIPQKDTRKDPKLFRTQDGKVLTQNPNILSSPSSKIDFKSMNQIKYVIDPYQNAKMIRRKQLFEDIQKRGENSFKPSSPVRQFFSSNKEQYKCVEVPQKKEKKTKYNIQSHDYNFRPAGNHFNGGIFSYPQHLAQQERIVDRFELKNHKQKKEPFKLIKQENNSKPCPSISLSKMNLMRCLR